MSPKDSFTRHIQRHLESRCGALPRQISCARSSRKGPRASVSSLMGNGFYEGSAGEDSVYELGLEGGHSAGRVLHAGITTGSETRQDAGCRKKPSPVADPILRLSHCGRSHYDEELGAAASLRFAWGLMCLTVAPDRPACPAAGPHLPGPPRDLPGDGRRGKGVSLYDQS